MATYDAITQTATPLQASRTGLADVRVNLRRRLFLWQAWEETGLATTWVSESPVEVAPIGYGAPIILQTWE